MEMIVMCAALYCGSIVHKQINTNEIETVAIITC